jgi:hypothetical protein
MPRWWVLEVAIPLAASSTLTTFGARWLLSSAIAYRRHASPADDLS